MPSGGSQGTPLSHEAASLSWQRRTPQGHSATSADSGPGPAPQLCWPAPPAPSCGSHKLQNESVSPLSCGAIPPTDPDPQLSGPPCVPRLSPPLPAPGLGGIPGAAGWVIPTAGTEDLDGASCSAREPSSPGRISPASVFLWDVVRLWWGCSSVSESAGCDVGCRVPPITEPPEPLRVGLQGPQEMHHWAEKGVRQSRCRARGQSETTTRSLKGASGHLALSRGTSGHVFL